LGGEKLEAFLKIVFAQPHKKLSKNLMAVFSQDIANSIFAKPELDSHLRPHGAVTSIYHQIYNELKDNLNGKQQQQEQRKVSKPRTANTQNRQTQRQKAKSSQTKQAKYTGRKQTESKQKTKTKQ
jgi:16S rRNA (adenine1518-N6/adenine1519-N6)-dimethyltransferase